MDLALPALARAIAIAWRLGLPAATSVLMLDEMVSSDIDFLRVVDHIDVAEVLGRIALMLAIDLDHFVDCITSAIQGHSLAWITDSVVFLILASVHLDK